MALYPPSPRIFPIDLDTQLRKEKEAFADAQQIMDDFTKFLHNGGLDVVGANTYDRQHCRDKHESLEVMLKARQNDLGTRSPGHDPSQESVELNLTILHDIILSAVYYMVPNNETRRVMNSGKLNLLYARDPSAPYDARYCYQNIPQWLKSLPQHLFEPYDHLASPSSSHVNIMRRPSVRQTHTTPSPPSTGKIPLLKPIHVQNHPRQRHDSERNALASKTTARDARRNDYRYLSHRNRSARYGTRNVTKPWSINWLRFCGCGRNASRYS